MRIATLNVWGRAGEWSARRSALRRAIAELRPDVVALQETFGDDHVREFLDGMDVVHQERRAPDGGGISIASRAPVCNVQELDLHLGVRPRDFAAGALMVEIEQPQVLVVNHFPSWQLDQEVEREKQAVMVHEWIEQTRDGRDLPAVVVGDMDAEPSANSVRFWTGRASLAGCSTCYSDAWEARHPRQVGETINFGVHEQDWPFKRIDYVLVRCGIHGGPMLTIERCDRWAEEPIDGVWPSDHFGVFADLA